MNSIALLLLAILLHANFASSARPGKQTVEEYEWNPKKTSRRNLGTEPMNCRSGNPIDDCWRCDPDWESNRKVLADCATGFGRNAIGGRDGDFYIVTDSNNDDPLNPSPGTLRHAVTQVESLWIVFNSDMTIQLQEELIVNSYKTIDGRGYEVEISNGPCLTLENVSNIIIHSVYIHDCVPANKAVGSGVSDGDGISLFGASNVWIDHCTLSHCKDGLIDAIYGSTDITISNNYMFDHNEVMLLGHSDDFLEDEKMQVTISFNYFGSGLVQRIPRCRHGYFHIVNNVYTGWNMYAIGGSANPTINSQGNVFIALDEDTVKEVTKHESSEGGEDWKNWNWRSDGDMMLNGAYFTSSGVESPSIYAKATSMVARPASLLQSIIPSAGVLSCQIGKEC